MKTLLPTAVTLSLLTAAAPTHADESNQAVIRFIDTFAVYPVKNPTERNSNACIIVTPDGESAYPGICSKHITLFLKMWEAAHPRIPYTVEENGKQWGEPRTK